MSEHSVNRIVIDSSALGRNYRRMREIAGVPVMAMVKADGYGHGMVGAARAFARAGCSLFGVAELVEGIQLRRAGIDGDIYVTLGFTEQDPPLLLQHALTPVLYSYEAAAALSRHAVDLGVKVGVHVKVDTGMSRLGLFPDELPPFIDALKNLPGIELAGLMSHFPEADNPQANSTVTGLARFTRACADILANGGIICHIASSGAVLNTPATRCSQVRCGIALYGYHPAGRGEGVPLEPAMSCVSRVLQVKAFPAGVGISYGHTYRTTRPSRLAVLPIGYEDGYSRALSNRGEVLLHGRRAPVRGRICMNMCIVDVTDIEGVKAGDEAVLLGRQGEAVVDADELAAKTGTVSYEILCMLGNNNKREYRD